MLENSHVPHHSRGVNIQHDWIVSKICGFEYVATTSRFHQHLVWEEYTSIWFSFFFCHVTGCKIGRKYREKDGEEGAWTGSLGLTWGPGSPWTNRKRKCDWMFVPFQWKLRQLIINTPWKYLESMVANLALRRQQDPFEQCKPRLFSHSSSMKGREVLQRQHNWQGTGLGLFVFCHFHDLHENRCQLRTDDTTKYAHFTLRALFFIANVFHVLFKRTTRTHYNNKKRDPKWFYLSLLESDNYRL